MIVMSEAASQRLRRGFGIARRKVTAIPHGAAVPTKASRMRGGRLRLARRVFAQRPARV